MHFLVEAMSGSILLSAIRPLTYYWSWFLS